MTDPHVLIPCTIAAALSAFAICSGQASVAGIGFSRAQNPRMFWVVALAPAVLAGVASGLVIVRG